jgi:hypothetical protein
MVRLGSVFVEALASGLGDREPGWLFRHPLNRAVLDQGVQRIAVNGGEILGQQGGARAGHGWR